MNNVDVERWLYKETTNNYWYFIEVLIDDVLDFAIYGSDPGNDDTACPTDTGLDWFKRENGQWVPYDGFSVKKGHIDTTTNRVTTTLATTTATTRSIFLNRKADISSRRERITERNES